MIFGFFKTPTATEVYERDVARLRAQGWDNARIAAEEWKKAKGLIDGDDPHWWGGDIARLVVRDFSAPDEACRWCAKAYHQAQEYANAFPLYKLLADKGNVECMTMIGYYGATKLAGVTEEMGEEYYAKAAALGDVGSKMHIAERLRATGNRNAAIAILQEIVDLGKEKSWSARYLMNKINGLPKRESNNDHQCVFCRKWFEKGDYLFVVKAPSSWTNWDGRCICWQCWGWYDQESVDRMIDIYWGWPSNQDKYSEITKEFRAKWATAVKTGGSLKRMEWEKVIWKEKTSFAYLKPCVCCERTVDKRNFTDVRFSGGDKVLCRQCLEEYDIDSLLRAGSHHSPCRQNWREQIMELKKQVGEPSAPLKVLPKFRVSRFTERHIIPFGNGTVAISDDPLIFED